jgi:hypothetical protein
MDIERVLAELFIERNRINEAIAALERWSPVSEGGCGVPKPERRVRLALPPRHLSRGSMASGPN